MRSIRTCHHLETGSTFCGLSPDAREVGRSPMLHSLANQQLRETGENPEYAINTQINTGHPYPN